MTESQIRYRSGDPAALVTEFIRLQKADALNFRTDALTDPRSLSADHILAVHYSDSGAQGEAGLVRLLYRTEQGVRILYGNYLYGDLNLNAVIEKLPMLKSLDSRYSLTPPYPFGGRLEVPDGWKYSYMGAMHYFFVRNEVCDVALPYIQAYMRTVGSYPQTFDAVAWLCRAPQNP